VSQKGWGEDEWRDEKGHLEKKIQSLSWWDILVISALGRYRQDDSKFKASLD
jgi:hypothetical protein